MNIKDDEYINSFDIKNVEDIDQVIDFMKGKKSLATWKEAIKKISEIDSYIDTIAKDRRPYIPKDVVWVTILEQYLSKIEKCYELIQKNCNYAGNRTELIRLSNTIAQSKYWAYCIYEEKKKLNIKLKNKIKNENKKENNINLYIALAEFWSAYNSDFDDYRRAIDMLCKNYPGNYQDMEADEKNKIENAFLDNVIYCGDKGDHGYCYQGINAMRTNMKCLDDKLLENIILRYKGDDIARFSQYRHQILTMIDCIGEETLKKKLIDNILYSAVVLNIILKEAGKLDTYDSKVQDLTQSLKDYNQYIVWDDLSKVIRFEEQLPENFSMDDADCICRCVEHVDESVNAEIRRLEDNNN